MWNVMINNVQREIYSFSKCGIQKKRERERNKDKRAVDIEIIYNFMLFWKCSSLMKGDITTLYIRLRTKKKREGKE